MEDFILLDVTHSIKPDTFRVMATFEDVPIILIYSIPKEYHFELECMIGIAINHEVLHIIIAEVEGEMASISLDNLFGMYEEGREWV